MPGRYAPMRWGWRTSTLLFLAFLSPLTPLLAGIQEERASAGSPHRAATIPDFGTAADSASAGRAMGDQGWTGIVDTALLRGPDRDLRLAAGAVPRHLLWLLLSQEIGPASGACADGSADGEREADGALWFFLGMFFYGVPIAYAIHPDPDEALLAGKSSADLATYADCYGDAVRRVHVKWAWIGLASIAALSLIAALILLTQMKTNFN